MKFQNGARREFGLNRLFLTLMVSSASLLASQFAADAQTSSGSGIEEVIVTATKRSESIQSVPMSITALPAAELEEAHVQSFEDFARMVPNISYSSGGEAFGRRLALRGIYGDNTVGFYIDDLPVPADLNPRVIDLDRIEVLRGPQGTLFGARSMGGTIRMITKMPDTEAFGGQVTTDASTMQDGTQGYQLTGTLNVPVIEDVAAFRATAYMGRDGAFINREWPDPTDPSKLDSRKVGGNDFAGGSFSGLYKPTEHLTIRATVLAQQSELDGWQLSDFTPKTMTQKRLFDIPEWARQRFVYTGLTVNYETSFGTFTSATSYFNSKSSSAEDASETTPFFFGVPALDGPPSLIWDPDHELTEEFRFASTFAGPLQFVGGIYYNKSMTGFRQLINTPGLDAESGGAFGTDLVFFENSRNRSSEEAPFGELTYKINDAWSATVGFRYSWITLRSFDTQDGLAGTGATVNLNGKEQAATPKFVIKYQPSEDLNVYALASKGFRPGSTQVAPPIGFCAADYAAAGLSPADLQSIDPDSLWNYEAGVKSGWLDGKLRVNADAFWINWDNIQQQARFNCGFNFTVNAGAARSRGFELEFAATPISHLNLSGGVGYTDAVITKSAAFLFTRVGDPVQNVAPWTGYVAADYDYPITSGLDGYLRADANYVGGSFSATNDPVTPRHRAPYTMFNLRIGVTTDAWEFAGYIDNVGNVHANLGDDSSGAAELPGRPRWLVSPPRTYGVQGIYRW